MYFFSLIKKSFLIIFILAVAVTLSAIVSAEEDASEKIIEVIGTGTIYGDDVAKARDRAIKNSLVSAVDLTVANILPLESMIQNFETLNEILYDNTSEFVEYYKVLTELKSGRTYRVLVQATVSTSVIEQQLMSAGIKVCKKNMPDILFFIAEQNLGDISPRYWWSKDLTFVKGYTEIAVTEKMLKNGFSVIDQKSLVINEEFETLKDKADLSNQDAVSLGAVLQADVVIVGNSKADITPNTMGGDIKSFKGTVLARALRTDTGEEIASTTQTAVSVNKDNIAGGRDALSNAGYLAGSDLASQIVMKWHEDVKKSITTLVIIVEGTRTLSNFVIFRTELNEIPGVDSLHTSEMKADEAAIVVTFQGNAKELADALMLMTFESFGINIYEISQDHLRIKLVSS
ncbi:MAG: hypothetical protein KAT52_00340 [Desulfobacterales bacterium]|jgi:hypothetical protein|nr:hypothetical protein [Desulfobacterales bacterium]MDL2124340.1 hypothetical protein [Deltaproteobacteria bacterium]